MEGIMESSDDRRSLNKKLKLKIRLNIFRNRKGVKHITFPVLLEL